jgi:death on curing protein
MIYLTGEDVLIIHSEILDATTGAHGVRDTGLLLSIIEKPKITVGGKDAYRTVFEKAAVYVESTARYHVFIDGNKRTAIACAARFLFLNGYELIASNRDTEAFVLEVVNEKLPISSVAEWLKAQTKKISR